MWAGRFNDAVERKMLRWNAVSTIVFAVSLVFDRFFPTAHVPHWHVVLIRFATAAFVVVSATVATAVSRKRRSTPAWREQAFDRLACRKLAPPLLDGPLRPYPAGYLAVRPFYVRGSDMDPRRIGAESVRVGLKVGPEAIAYALMSLKSAGLVKIGYTVDRWGSIDPRRWDSPMLIPESVIEGSDDIVPMFSPKW